NKSLITCGSSDACEMRSPDETALWARFMSCCVELIEFNISWLVGFRSGSIYEPLLLDHVNHALQDLIDDTDHLAGCLIGALQLHQLHCLFVERDSRELLPQCACLRDRLRIGCRCSLRLARLISQRSCHRGIELPEGHALWTLRRIVCQIAEGERGAVGNRRWSRVGGDQVLRLQR